VKARTLADEHRRVRRAFVAALCALGPCALAQACGGGSATDAKADAAGGEVDGTVPASDAPTTTPPPSANDAAEDRRASDDGPNAFDGPRNCGAQITLIDAGGPSDADADVDTLCSYAFACGVPSGVTNVGCDIVPADLDGAPLEASPALRCRLVEGQGCLADAFAPSESGAVTMECIDCLGGPSGRRTAGIVRARVPFDGAGGYFARMAHAEAASVFAFQRLRGELARHGAPASLLRATESAANDEVRHARTMSTLAAAHGASPPRARVRAMKRPRSLEALARENAVEGCVHETFGALVAWHQARHAADGEVRRAFARLAADETRHAALAWSVARWAAGRLAPAARARVEAARHRAARALRTALAVREGAPFDALVGNPSPGDAAALHAGLVRELTLSAGTAPSARRRRGTARGDRAAPSGKVA